MGRFEHFNFLAGGGGGWGGGIYIFGLMPNYLNSSYQLFEAKLWSQEDATVFFIERKCSLVAGLRRRKFFALWIKNM